MSGVRSGRGGCFWGSGHRAQKLGPVGIGSGMSRLCLCRAHLARFADRLACRRLAPKGPIAPPFARQPAVAGVRAGGRCVKDLGAGVRARGRKPYLISFGFPPRDAVPGGKGLGPNGPGPGAVAAGPRGLAVSGTYPGHPAPVWGRLCSGIAPGEGPGSSPIPTGWCPGYVPGGHHT